MTKAKAIEILNEAYDGFLIAEKVCSDAFKDEITDRKIALLTAIDALEQDNGWISVKDRMPEEGKSILCCVFGRSVGEGVYRGFGGFDGRHHVWYMYALSGMYWNNEVTHWRPLPEPPESEAPDRAERSMRT